MLFLRLAALFGLIYSLPHFEENPVVISVAAGLCLLFILFLGDDQIVVYNDKITQTTNSLFDLVFGSKGKTFKIADIRSAYLEIPQSSSSLEIGTVAMLMLLLPKKRTSSNKTIPIYFELRNGGTAKFDTDLESDTIEEIVDWVNKLTDRSDH